MENEGVVQACMKCGSIGASCCATAKARKYIAGALEKIVGRQSLAITRLNRELQEARQVISDLRRRRTA